MGNAVAIHIEAEWLTGVAEAGELGMDTVFNDLKARFPTRTARPPATPPAP